MRPAQQKEKILIPCVAYIKFLLGSIDLEHGIMPGPQKILLEISAYVVNEWTDG